VQSKGRVMIPPRLIASPFPKRSGLLSSFDWINCSFPTPPNFPGAKFPGPGLNSPWDCPGATLPGPGLSSFWDCPGATLPGPGLKSPWDRLDKELIDPGNDAELVPDKDFLRIKPSENFNTFDTC
jgi:hypothetical protein